MRGCPLRNRCTLRRAPTVWTAVSLRSGHTIPQRATLTGDSGPARDQASLPVIVARSRVESIDLRIDHAPIVRPRSLVFQAWVLNRNRLYSTSTDS
jgi:hypothetical protein